MKKNVIIAGFLGGIVMFIWLFISNAILPYKSDMIHKIVPNQLEVHEVLRENIKETGIYSCPYLGPQEEKLLPDYRNQPIFSITYSGITHGDPATISMLVPVLIVFLVPLIAAWMLSMTSDKILAKYYRRVIFVALFGVIVSLYDDILQISFGPTFKNYMFFLAVNNIITWTIAGFAIAWRIKPAKS